jgi:hypothetical protein
MKAQKSDDTLERVYEIQGVLYLGRRPGVTELEKRVELDRERFR